MEPARLSLNQPADGSPNMALSKTVSPSGASIAVDAAHGSDYGSTAMEGLLSEDAARIIKDLQRRLKKAKHQLRIAESNAQRAAAAAEECATISSSFHERQTQVSKKVAKSHQDRAQQVFRQQALENQLEALRTQIISVKAANDTLVPKEEHDQLCSDLSEMLQHLEEASGEEQLLRRQVAEAEATHRRRERRKLMRAKEEADAERRTHEHAATIHDRRSEARRLSDRAVAEQKGRFSTRQLERVAQLRNQKERIELELKQTSSHNAYLERQLEALRAKNRQIEAQEKKLRQEAEEQEVSLKADIRRRTQQFRLLTAVMRESEMSDGDETAHASTSSPCASARASQEPLTISDTSTVGLGPFRLAQAGISGALATSGSVQVPVGCAAPNDSSDEPPHFLIDASEEASSIAPNSWTPQPKTAKQDDAANVEGSVPALACHHMPPSPLAPRSTCRDLSAACHEATSSGLALGGIGHWVEDQRAIMLNVDLEHQGEAADDVQEAKIQQDMVSWPLPSTQSHVGARDFDAALLQGNAEERDRLVSLSDHSEATSFLDER